MKICTRCTEMKPLSEFHRRLSGYRSACKICIHNERGYRDWKPRRPKDRLGQRFCGRCRKFKDLKDYPRLKHGAQGRGETCKTCLNEKTVIGYRTNENVHQRRLLRFKLGRILFKAVGIKDCEWLTGLSVESLKAWFEQNFKPGMTWDNHGEWEVDHIIPCCAFDLTTEEAVKACFHWTNLQPLWKYENLTKGSK